MDTEPADGTYDVAVVGGGIAGLATAWHLRDLDVLVLEASDRLGGRIKSEPRGDVWLNFGAHVFGGSGSATGRLLDATGVQAEQVEGRLAAVALGGRVVASGMVETYPFRLPLPLASRAALVRACLTQIVPDDDGVTVRYQRGDTEYVARAQHAVVATPAYVTRQIVSGLPAETAAALDAMRYGPYVVGSFLTGETGPTPWDGLYA